jgi:hypothetical protein
MLQPSYISMIIEITWYMTSAWRMPLFLISEQDGVRPRLLSLPVIVGPPQGDAPTRGGLQFPLWFRVFSHWFSFGGLFVLSSPCMVPPQFYWMKQVLAYAPPKLN